MKRTVAGFVFVFALALAPRVVDHERFVTVDEGAHWLARTKNFYEGLSTGDLAATAQAPHPGVTTMWLGSAGLLALDLADAPPPRTVEEKHTWRMALRTPVSIVTALTVALGWLLLRRLFPPAIAMLGAVLWALDPFVGAHSSILHVDGLATAFLTLSLLAAMLAWKDSRHGSYALGMWVLSALAGALALLSKLSAVFAVIAVAVIAVRAAWGEDGRRVDRLSTAIVRTFQPLVAWGALALAVGVLLWPAVWVDPVRVGNKLAFGAGLASSAHEVGNFFLGEPVEDPGPLYYPVVIALRTVPWTTIGLLLGLLYAARKRDEARTLVIAAFVVGIGLTVAPKKFDRYALPLFPAIDVLAAVGLAESLAAARRRVLGDGPDNRDAVVLVGAALAAGGGYLAWCHPYELAAYNPMFGGTKSAERLILVGWGEGLEEVGDYLRANTKACNRIIAAAQPDPLQPWVCNPVYRMEHARSAEYVVTYVNSTQRRLHPKALAKYEAMEPVFVVERYGVRFAAVYKNPTKPKAPAKPSP